MLFKSHIQITVKGADYFLSTASVSMSSIMVSWNVIGYFIFFANCPYEVPVLYDMLELLLPLIFFVLHVILLNIWKGSDLESDLGVYCSFRQHVSLMIHYLNSSSTEINVNERYFKRRDTTFYLNFCRLYITSILTIFVIFLVTNVLFISTSATSEYIQCVKLKQIQLH